MTILWLSFTLIIIYYFVYYFTWTCTQECVIVKFHHIMNMHDQFMGMNTIQLPFPTCFPAFYALAIPMSCYISNVFYYLLHKSSLKIGSDTYLGMDTLCIGTPQTLIMKHKHWKYFLSQRKRTRFCIFSTFNRHSVKLCNPCLREDLGMRLVL